MSPSQTKVFSLGRSPLQSFTTKFVCVALWALPSLFSVLLSSSWYLWNMHAVDYSSAKAASDVSTLQSSPQLSSSKAGKKKKKRWQGRKGLEISVTNRWHPVNFSHMSPCDTYSVSIKLKPESIIKKKNLSDASWYNIKIDYILGQLFIHLYSYDLLSARTKIKDTDLPSNLWRKLFLSPYLWAAGFRWPYLSRGVEPYNLQRSLPTSVMQLLRSASPLGNPSVTRNEIEEFTVQC